MVYTNDRQLDFLIERCKGALATSVVLAWRAEWGPSKDPVTGHTIFGPLQTARVIAYIAGDLLTWDAPPAHADRHAIRAYLESHGLTVSERCRNLGDYAHEAHRKTRP